MNLSHYNSSVDEYELLEPSILIFYRGDRTSTEYTVEGLLGFCGLVFNLCVVVVIHVMQALRRPTANWFIGSLAVANCFMSSGVLYFNLVLDNDFKTNSKIGPICTARVLASMFVCCSTCLSRCVIALDRHLYIAAPLHYEIRMTTTKAAWLISFVWITSIVFSVFPAVMEWTVYSATEDMCRSVKKRHRFFVGFYLVTLIFSAVVIVFVYIQIFIWAYNQIRGMQKETNANRERRVSVTDPDVLRIGHRASRILSQMHTSSYFEDSDFEDVDEHTDDGSSSSVSGDCVDESKQQTKIIYEMEDSVIKEETISYKEKRSSEIDAAVSRIGRLASSIFSHFPSSVWRQESEKNSIVSDFQQDNGRGITRLEFMSDVDSSIDTLLSGENMNKNHVYKSTHVKNNNNICLLKNNITPSLHSGQYEKCRPTSPMIFLRYHSPALNSSISGLSFDGIVVSFKRDRLSMQAVRPSHIHMEKEFFVNRSFPHSQIESKKCVRNPCLRNCVDPSFSRCQLCTHARTSSYDGPHTRASSTICCLNCNIREPSPGPVLNKLNTSIRMECDKNNSSDRNDTHPGTKLNATDSVQSKTSVGTRGSPPSVKTMKSVVFVVRDKADEHKPEAHRTSSPMSSLSSFTHPRLQTGSPKFSQERPSVYSGRFSYSKLNTMLKCVAVKAAVVVFCIIGSYIGLWGPFAGVVIHQYYTQDDDGDITQFKAVLWAVYLCSVMDTFLYAVLNQAFRMAVTSSVSSRWRKLRS